MFRNTRHRIKNSLNHARSFFDRGLRTRDDAEWLFLLTPPNSGSTALARLLLSSPGVVGLNEVAEGQWLVPQMRAPAARWDPAHPMPYRLIRAAWLQKLRKIRPRGPVLVVEKTPANLCRHRELSAAMAPMPTHLVTLIRNPYATISSWNQRYGLEVMTHEWDPRGAEARGSEEAYFDFMTTIWLERARLLLAARDDALVNVCYESFVADPAETVRLLTEAIPALAGVDAAASIRVKHYAPQPIRDMNPKQIDQLTETQVAAIGRRLETDRPTVEALGYEILG